MMKLESLSVSKFRGIKELNIPFDGKSWVIQGRNGSGKSGVIDAIEFAISGSIGRLTGEGRGGMSVKEHGPHVDYRSSPKEAQIKLQLKFGPNQSLTLTRNCDFPAKFSVLPKELKDSWVPVGNEFVLSRREILKFVLTEPSERSKRVQAILKIDKLEKIRASLQTLKNKAKKNFEVKNDEFVRAKTRLRECLQIKELNREEALAAINKHRTNLGLQAITELGKNIKIGDGIVQDETKNQYVNKTELTSLWTAINNSLIVADEAFNATSKSYLSCVEKLEGKENEIRSLAKLGFYESSLKLISSDQCPLCETEWEQAELKSVIEEKIKEIANVKGIKNEIDVLDAKLKSHWRSLKVEIDSLKNKTKDLKSFDTVFLDDLQIQLTALIEKSESDSGLIRNALTSMTSFGLVFENGEVVSALEKISSEIKSLPEKSDKESSRETLIVCQERYDNYYEVAAIYEVSKLKFAISSSLLDKFNDVAETYLNELYEGIESDFSKYYQIVNSDDESSFKGRLQAENGALDFKVDFFGRGQFPPVAYHSEGHQDGMGLCLYLALMKKILGDKFTIAVLDDVLMSVDADHRKSFCKLLKQEFPDTQFIITTHDKMWQKQMITEGLVNHSTSLCFKNWSVDTGPSVWSETDSWSEIDDHIHKGNISEASLVLRRFLEYFMDEMSVRLSASIPRTASGDHDLGELLSGTTSRYAELLKKAKRSARSWGNPTLEANLESEKVAFDECLKRARSEMWAVNATVHFNSWADMGKPEFLVVRKAYSDLIQCFKCNNCGTLLHVIPAKGSSEILKCDCNLKTYNLKEKGH